MTNTELGFATTQLIPTAIAKSNPVRVTVEDNGLVNGQVVRATRFYSWPLDKATGMYQLNNKAFVVGNATTDTFDLYDQYGEPIDGTNYVTFVSNGLGQFNLTGPELFTQNLNEQED